MPQVQPSAEILYRIQNVDYGQYLEFSSRETAEGRPLTDSATQRWRFVRQPGKNVYKIVNAAPSEIFENINPALGVDASDSTTVAEDEDGVKTYWTIDIQNGNPYCTISTTNPSPNARGRVLLQMDRDGSTKVDGDKHQDKQKWKIIEVLPSIEPSPPLAKGTYRVRNIDSALVLTGEPGSVTLAKQESGKDQAWEVLPKGNGKYEIKKDGKAEYLTWQDDKVIIANKPGLWIVRSLGAFVYSISPKLDEDKDELGLTAGKPDNHEVLLTAREIIRSQVWFIELFKSASKLDSPEPDSPKPGSRDQAERFAVSGNVGIQNLQSTWRASYSHGEGRIYNTGNGIPGTAWIMSYESPVSPYFTLQAGSNIVYASMSGDTIVPSRAAMLWYLARDGKNQGCYICPKGNSRLVWGYGPSVEGVSDYQLPVRLVERKANTPSQMWRIGDYQ